MKKLATVLALVVFAALGAQAHPENHNNNRGSVFVLNLTDCRDYIVVFDGQRYFPVDKFKITNLAPGQHKIRVVRKDQYGQYGRGEILYNGFIDIPYGSKVVARTTPRGYFNIMNVVPLYAQHQHRPQYRQGFTCAPAPARPARYYENRNRPAQRQYGHRR